LFYWLVKYALRPVFRVLFRPRVSGAHHIPRSGGALLASNHLSMCDSLFLPAMTRRRVSFLAKQEYFTGRGVKGRAKAAFVRGTGLIPIDREDTDAAAAALATGARAVEQGMLLGVYPEGTRSPDGRLFRGKTGVARMAMDTGVPVVPVGMVGTDRVQPIGTVVPKIARVGVRVGPPLQPPVPSSDPDVEREIVRAFTEQIMASIAGLSGQERVDLDAAEHKKVLRRGDAVYPGDELSRPAPTTPLTAARAAHQAQAAV
jgi:1-acyl-sn-glycerol-3-phosphate acyltransferase